MIPKPPTKARTDRHAALLLICLSLLPFRAPAATKLLVTAVEPKSGKPIADLKAGEIVVLDDKTPQRVESIEPSTGPLDVILLLDTSLMGAMVQPVADNLIAQLQAKDQMAIVSLHSSADMIQDFTSSHELLIRSVSEVKYGNSPHILDGLYATLDGGFQNTTFRRVILLLTAGVEGNSRVNESEVIRMARRNSVSIFSVYVVGYEKYMFDLQARQTGGASFHLKDLRKTTSAPGQPIFEALRAYYTVTLSGNHTFGEKIKVEIKRPEKVFASGLPVD